MFCRSIILLFYLISLGSCRHPSWQDLPHDRRFQRAPSPINHSSPKTRRAYVWSDIVKQTTAHSLGNTLSPQHWIDRSTGGGLSALDINNFGEVVDSTWFTNRIGRGSMSEEAVILGPAGVHQGPAEGPLNIIRAKIEGASPGLLLKDQTGTTFLAKFDPPAYPGLASGAEVITTKILYAAGYNVPVNTVIYLPISRLQLDPGQTNLTEEKLRSILQLANPNQRGEIRALFSRVIDGQPVGPFSYEGTRSDDPNDTIPHERRRSLRGYRWFAAWANNTDTPSSNTLDVFRYTKDKKGHLVHYLIDFGDALGSLGTEPKYASDGYDPIWSWSVVGELFFSLGFRYRYWLPVKRSRYRSVGFFEADVFDPTRWSPSYPNPAFEQNTALDTFWAAAIMAEFSHPVLTQIVESAKYESPRATQYVADILWQRRNKILEMAFKRVSPLNHPQVDQKNTIHLTDLAVRERLQREVKYRYKAKLHQTSQVIATGITSTPSFPLMIDYDEYNLTQYPFATLSVWRVNKKKEGPALHLHLRYNNGFWVPIGLDREVR